MNKIIALNANSLISQHRKAALVDFMSDNPALIYAISETKLGDANRFHIGGFNIFRQNNNHKRGGTMLLINNNLQVANISATNEPIESISADCKIGSEWIRITAIYVNSAGVDIEKFTSFFDRLGRTGSYIVAGDTNARHSQLMRATTAIPSSTNSF